MNKEVHYEGWLIKSPPTKRIWRARWRRRWFTLKQGEIPEQFCLEYYTDRNCRKLKGVIDLDQCEQVDCGLRLENRKQKFQFMFDIKTPKRTFYLAADTEADMRDWVNCICQVCHLHDTKQSNELQEDNRTASTGLNNSTTNTTTTSLNTSSSAHSSSVGPAATSTATSTSTRQSFNSEILRQRGGGGVVDRQPVASHSDAAYVNTEYTNRDTLVCESRLPPPSPGAALYLNSPVFQQQSDSARLAVNANGVVRKIPENLVLNTTPLPEAKPHSVQPSPALSTASGPYIPISECFSGSPKYLLDGVNPSTPLNNLDPKFYDTPRSHNNIGLNLTNDQSYSPKITNCGLQQQVAGKNRSHRSDSDSESVFTDDDEWTHPMPLRENVDRSTRPSDSSIENESFVLTYSQRFAKMPEDGAPLVPTAKEQKALGLGGRLKDPLDKLAKVLKNKNNLILDFKEHDKLQRDLPQLSDTENTSPAIGPRDASSVVEESYDIPRSHNLPYYNMTQLHEQSERAGVGGVASPEANPIAASTPNLMSTGGADSETSPASVASVRTLPRPHCYTNAAPTKVEGNVFRYDFIEQSDLPPVNRKLKPKVNSVEDKPPEEVPAKPPIAAQQQQQQQPNSPHAVDSIIGKLIAASMQGTPSSGAAPPPSAGDTIGSPLRPPSVDRKLKPSVYKVGASATMSPSTRRSTGAPLSMLLPHEEGGAGYVIETHTLPRQPQRPTNYAAGVSMAQHQRTASASAAGMGGAGIMQQLPASALLLQLPAKNEHKLQYFDLDVANPPPVVHRQSMSVGNLHVTAAGGGGGALRLGLPADPAARTPPKSSVVYNSVDFVKTEAFKRIREERKKESEGVYNNTNAGGGSQGGK